MNKRVIGITLGMFVMGITHSTLAQDIDKKILNWYNGKKAGMNTEKAYKKLKKRDSKTVIVAVIDSGIDIEHEDLKGKIWTNTDEIAGNGIDDDNNGYIDDVHGWNFLGNPGGENANSMRLEFTRIIARYSEQFEGADRETLGADDQKLYDTYMQCVQDLEKDRSRYEGFINMRVPMLEMMIDGVPATLKEKFGKEDVSLKELRKHIKKNPEEERSLSVAMAVVSGQISKDDFKEQAENVKKRLDTHYNIDFDGRAVVGDDPYDMNDRNYGNNDVEGPDALHGTHVGGIIGAVRGNGLGGDGVCENVLLMSIRAVPDGDEFDKDIALAIRYAVDNGASVINMSFGKKYSPMAKEVYEALEYADSKGVLLVHAAGNDDKNVDEEPNFPTSMYDMQTKKLDHYLTIGASTRDTDKKLAAAFSNWGQKGVDVFAPGHEIWNTVQDNKYEKLQGTSMAAPMVSGVAAMLKSYFPEMSMKEIKDVILKSAQDFRGTIQILPGTEDEEVDFATLSVTGGVVNAYNAVNMCLEMGK